MHTIHMHIYKYVSYTTYMTHMNITHMHICSWKMTSAHWACWLLVFGIRPGAISRMPQTAPSSTRPLHGPLCQENSCSIQDHVKEHTVCGIMLSVTFQVTIDWLFSALIKSEHTKLMKRSKKVSRISQDWHRVKGLTPNKDMKLSQ